MADFDRAIPPGGVGKVTLKVKTKGLQGRVTKSANIRSNASNLQTAKIYLSINVRPHIIVEPARRIVLRGVVGEDVRQVLRIRPADDRPLEISKVETNLGSAIDYELRPRGDGRQYELEVAVKSAGSQIFNGYLKLLTNHPAQKQLKLFVHVRVKPELEVRPDRVIFRKRSTAGTIVGQLRRMLTMVNNLGKPFRIRELSYNEEYFEVRSVGPADKSSSKHQLEVVALVERLPAGRVGLEDTLIIKTDIAQAAELKVPMRIQIETSP